MLVNFRFKNFRSFYNETNLSLQATKNKELREFNTFEVDEKLLGKNNNELIKSAVIFGSNASGKTNVIRALTYMLNCIRLSAANPLPFIKGNEYFAFYDEANKEESLYEVEIIKNNAYYRYGFTIKEGKITNEWLDRKVERITNIFKRDVEKISINGQEQGLMGLIKIPAETLFLSIANNFNLKNIEYIKDVIAWFNSLLIVFENNANSLDIYSLEGGKYHDQALEILKKADIGIKSFEVEKDKIANAKLPKQVKEQFPKMYRMRKMPLVIAKIGPQITTLLCDEKIYTMLPTKKQVKVELAGLFIVGIKGPKAENTSNKSKKGNWLDKLKSKVIKK